MEYINLDDLKRHPSGDDLDQLVRQVRGLKSILAALDRESDLYLSDKGGQIFGQILPSEAKETRKRIREKIESQIEKVMKEIRKRVEAF